MSYYEYEADLAGKLRELDASRQTAVKEQEAAEADLRAKLATEQAANEAVKALQNQVHQLEVAPCSVVVWPR